MTTVSESGLYGLVFRSRKPEARRFRKWVTSEVLPALRRSGSYGAPLAAPRPLPEAARTVRPSLRATALHAAVQAAKMIGGGEEDIERLFASYCVWLAARPALPSGGKAWQEAFESWAEACVSENHRARTRSWDLYNHFRRWLHQEKPGVQVPSIKAWGSEMSGRFRRFKSGAIWYNAVLIDVED